GVVLLSVVSTTYRGRLRHSHFYSGLRTRSLCELRCGWKTVDSTLNDSVSTLGEPHSGQVYTRGDLTGPVRDQKCPGVPQGRGQLLAVERVPLGSPVDELGDWH